MSTEKPQPAPEKPEPEIVLPDPHEPELPTPITEDEPEQRPPHVPGAQHP